MLFSLPAGELCWPWLVCIFFVHDNVGEQRENIPISSAVLQASDLCLPLVAKTTYFSVPTCWHYRNWHPSCIFLQHSLYWNATEGGGATCVFSFSHVWFCTITDLPAMDNSVFLELFRLDRNLPLYRYLCFPWRWLPGVHLYSCIQTSTARHSAAHSDSGSAGFPKGRSTTWVSSEWLLWIHGNFGAKLPTSVAERHAEH